MDDGKLLHHRAYLKKITNYLSTFYQMLQTCKDLQLVYGH